MDMEILMVASRVLLVLGVVLLASVMVLVRWAPKV
jgi:hypothetical protein